VSFVLKDYSDPLIDGKNLKFKKQMRCCNVKLREAFVKKGIKVSIGSACNTSESGPSHVLTELHLPFIVRCGVMRFSVSDMNSEHDIEKFGQVLKSILK
jgi:cysteine sulfinate desulfinase/cysteine desulfurase-like protein